MNISASRNLAGGTFDSAIETDSISDPGSSTSAATSAISLVSRGAASREQPGPPEDTLTEDTLTKEAEPSATGSVGRRRPYVAPVDLDIDLAGSLRLNTVRDDPRTQLTFVALQEWEGLVDRITPDAIEGRLVDITAGEKVWSQYFSLPLEEISDFNRRRMQIGSIFRWVLGYEKQGDTQRRFAEIILREIPRWREDDLRRAKEQGASLAGQLRVLDREQAAGGRST